MTTQVHFRKATVIGPNPAPFDSPINLRVVLELQGKPLEDVIDVRFTWSPIWDTCVDQVLDELEVGPLSHSGTHELTLSSDPPRIAEIPDPTGPTALLVSFCYKSEEFLHLGFNILAKFEKDTQRVKNRSNAGDQITDERDEEEEEEIPEIITSSEGVTRHIIEPCFPKHTCIKAWETLASKGSGETEENHHEGGEDGAEYQQNKRPKHEAAALSSSDDDDSSSSCTSSLSDDEDKAI